MNDDAHAPLSEQRNESHDATSTFRSELESLFEELTGDGSSREWGLQAAIAIARFRKQHRQGPTFTELFEEIVIFPGAEETTHTPPRHVRELTRRFRHHVAVHWRRLGWIDWNHNTRSLRTGRKFRVASRAWIQSQQLEP